MRPMEEDRRGKRLDRGGGRPLSNRRPSIGQLPLRLKPRFDSTESGQTYDHVWVPPKTEPKKKS